MSKVKMADVTAGPRIDIMQAYRTQLVKPTLADGQTLNGDRLARIFTQRVVWLRPTGALQPETEASSVSCTVGVNESIDLVDPEEPMPASPVVEASSASCTYEPYGPEKEAVRISSHLTPASSSVQVESDGPSCSGSIFPELVKPTEDTVAQFIDMFPEIPPETVSFVVKENCSLDGRVMADRVLEALTSVQNEETGQETLDTFIHLTKVDGVQPVAINRFENFCGGILRLYKSRSMDLRKTPQVTFSNEPAQDEGGVRLEFFSCALESLVQGRYDCMPLFEGTDDHKLPCANRCLLSAGVFKIVGKVLAHSLLHGGPGLKGLARPVAHMLTSGTDSDTMEKNPPPMCLDDIADSELQEIITKIDSSLDEGIPEELKSRAIPYLEESSFGNLNLTVSNSQQVTNHLMIYFDKRLKQIKDIQTGMQELSLFTFLKANPTQENVEKAFPMTVNVKLCADKVLTRVEFSPDIPLSVREYFQTFIKDLDGGDAGGCTLQDMLMFWTSKADVASSDTLRVEVEEEGIFPTASTCFFELKLPVHNTYDKFKMNMIKALEFSQSGFGVL